MGIGINLNVKHTNSKKKNEFILSDLYIIQERL